MYKRQQLERETIAERVSDNYYSRIRTGAWPGGRAPFGFCNTRLISGGHSVPSLSADENAPTVRRIFSEYASSGRSLASIAKELSKEKSASAARSRGWDSKSLSRMLRSPVYTLSLIHILNILSRVITRGLVTSGRNVNLTIALTDKPGQLQEVSEDVYKRQKEGRMFSIQKISV